ncbi:Ig-like domain-containing protein [Escherichia fergusonii]|uniref:BapA-related adhesin SiiEA n=1 Tax=Escherichia fergusonii TaxID=564 RepID=UPI0015E910A6|nr:Ig-like domain-containing protein [Escherichia fergusonii]QMB00644.1 Ig-like domain-containing protein [Escherichia fergusonii]QMB09607.1 Ig-like domain-containing protein [Escherichia fergusonii]QMC63484.1 Ig-like domain-containing protein [Escherichia fergusonii]
MSLIIDVISRKTSVKQTLINPGDVTVVIYEPSVVQVHAQASAVARYVRDGNDLLIYMQDGTVIRCNGYFLQAANTSEQSELVFADGQQLTHVTFADTAAGGLAPVELTAQTTAIESIAPYLDTVAQTSAFPWGWLAGAAVGGGALGALLASGGDDDSKTEVVNNPPPAEPGNATPSFLVTDNQGDQRGILSANDITDDTTPTFSGSGQAGATIQIKDSNGDTIASTQVGSDGRWSVDLPTQSAGEHTWSVVQIVGSTITNAGSITLTIDNSQAAVQLATTAGDNIINASEQAAGFTLSGTSSHLAQGTELTVTLNGKTYTTSVGANGAWSVQVPTADAQTLGEGNQAVLVSGKDATGNTVTGAQLLTVDTQPPTLAINTIAQDNIVSASEHNASLVVSGTSNAEAGQTVTLTVNGKSHTATVGSDGTWQVTLPAAEVQALADGDYAINASVSDRAGNTTSNSVNFTVDTGAPVVSVNTVAGDDILNTAEQIVAQIISGRVSGASPGDTVTVKLGATVLFGVVQADGSWNVALDPAVTRTLARGPNDIIVTVTDAAGNTGTATHNITLAGVAPQVAIDAISGDNVLNALESQQPLTLSGTSNLPDGGTVSVTLNNVTYSAQVSGGVWSLSVPVSDVVNLANTNYTVTASATDVTGNTGTAQSNLLVDTVLPQVIINTFAGDNIVNNAEAGADQTLSGVVVGAAQGDTVTIELGGNTYTATVGSNLTWSVNVPAADLQALGDGALTINASVTNVHGNTGSSALDITISAGLPGLRIDTIAGDDVINAVEQQQNLIITGSSTNLPAGRVVTVLLGGNTYQGVTDSNGNWQVGVPAADLQALTPGTIVVNASATDPAGNPVTIDRNVEVNPGAVLITINTVSGDDIINAAEKGAPLTLTGTTQLVETGQTVVVKFAGQTFTTTVQAGGGWSLTVPASAVSSLADGATEITATVTNISGNTGDTSRTITVDSQAPALSIDSLTADNIINAAESGQDLPITGTTDAQPGQTVTVTLNGQTYQGVVQSDGTWSVTVPAANVDALADGNATVTASVNDVAGNPTSVSRVALVDATPPVVTINPVATDNVINTPEHTQAQIISGTVTGAQAGDIVTVTLNDVDYTTVVDASGNWSLGVPASVVSGLVDGSYPINVSVTDRAGNTGSQSLTVTVDTAAPVIGINTIAGDDVINASEKGADVQITGTSDQPVNTAITVTLNGQNYTTTTDASGNWSVTVPASAVTALGQANYTVTAAVTSNIGNSNTASHNVLIDSALPGVTINPVATDDIINAAEAGAAQTIIGQVTGAAVGDTVTVTLGGNTYTATVQANLSWSVSVPAADIQALGNGDLTVSASVTNQNGNTGSGTRDITIDANLPGLRVDTVAGDDVVNIIEHGQALVITGSSSGLAEGTPLTVTINNVEYTTAVQADGSWSVGVTAAQVSAWPAGTVTVTVSGESSAGNPISITHPVTVDLTPAAITINTIATDDVINAAEKGADLTLSGTTTNVEPGQTVTITFGGKNYTASVASDGSWTATVPAADLTALAEGSASAQASVSNVNGNSASAVHSYSVDSSAPTIIINTVASDNIVNGSEADAGVTVSGSTTAEAGQIVTITLNSPTVQTYQATVQADGSWSINIPAADLAALTDGSHTLTATVNDKAGNPASTTHNLAVDLTVPVLTINTIAGDDIINAAEHGQALVISGSSTGGEAGDVVTVTLNSKTYTTTLDASGNWSVGVPAADVSALGSGPQTVTATVTDVAGNSDNETHTVTVNLTAPTIGINPIASDDVINATEKGADLQISGTSNQPAGTTITVTLNGQNYSATTDAAGNWSTTVPASAVGALGEASYTVTANVTDSAGNSNSASHNVQVNTALPGVTINPVATDDIINAAESGVAQTISGQVTGAAAGDTVTVTLGGKTYTATVQGNFSWSVDVPAADIQAIGNGDLTVNASVTNGVGNTGSGARDIVIDANLPGLRVDTVAGDDVVNSIEHAQALVITGSSSGLAAGAALTVVINNVTYGATVLADGTWSVGVPAADVGNWPAGTVNITVSGASSAGNPVTITHPVTVDLAAVAISINTVSGDDVINAAEKGADLTLSGSTSGVEAGQTVTVTFGGKTYTATVAGDGSWTTTVPAADLSALRDGDATVQASVSNINGNTASATHAYSVDATAPTLAINTIATDDILNAAEAGNPLTISGTSTAEAGQTVTVTLNGVAYIGTVQAGGSWSVSVPTTDLSNLTASPYTVSASVSDKAGNPATATHGLAVDLTVPVLTINTVSGDDIINAAEHGQALVISGSSTGGEVGDVITITLNSKTYTTTLDASGNWSVGVPAADVTALGSGPQTITAAITDAAGNSDDASRTVTVNLTAPTIGINTIASDDVINATEKGADLQITGTSNQPAGTTITVTLNGQNYTATTDSSGNWSATVPASAASALGEANYTVTASVTDTAGNSNSASHNVLVNSALPGVTINAVATDDIINAAEAGSAQTISGQVTGAAQGDTVTVTLGGNTYTATVQANLSWSVSVPAADIQALGNGDLTVNASVTNVVGNSGSGSRDITIDANLPGLRVDTVAGDDVINSIEHNQALVITGSSTGLTAGTALTVVINNVTYAATVLTDGTWNLGVPAADVSNWPAGTVDITVSGTNSAGTTSTITHPVTVDLAAVAITINTLSGDDVINAVEKGETLVVSGSTSGVEAGQTVTVTFGGKNYTTTVEANGSWTVNVPPADLAALPDGAGNVQASVSNINGNSAQADRAYSVDATAPLVTINPIASDDILNVSEAGAGITISGTTTAQAGQTLTVTLNNNTYQTTVQADGTWSVNVPATDLSGLTASSYTVTATVSDKAGNPASADHALVVDVTAPDLTINTVAGDDIINAIEHGQALVVSGTSTGAAAGDVVTVTLNGKNYTTTLDASGNWSVGIPAADVTALATGSQTITASLSDRAGNSDSTTHNVTVDLSGPTLTINTVSGDDIINNAEKTQDLIISGGSSGLATGTTVTVMLNGLAYSATTDGSGNWSVTVPASAVGALGEAVYQISASATDSAGNSGSTTHTVNVESLLPGVIINTVAGDDIINAAEIGVNQTISGQVTGTAAAGDTVTVTLGGNQYTATVQPDLSWSVSVPANVLQALGNGELTISASVTNSANNTGTATHDIVIDANLPGLRVDTVAGDDVVNIIEHGQALVVTGSSSGLAAGAALTVVINSVTYGATVLADGTWSVGVPAADVANWPAGTVNIAVSGTNTAGTTTSITHPVTVDLAAVAITINTLSTDDVINAAEKGTDLQLSGTTSDVEAGQTITVIFGGKSYITTVAADNTWGLTIPAADLATLPDGAANIQASVNNVAGNNAQATHVYSVDATAPSVTINTIASDDILNAAEAGSALTISGTSTAEAGQTVTVTLNGINYSGNVQADGSWSVSVPTGDLANLTASPYTVSAAVSDKAGNPTSATHNLTVDLAAPVVTINTVAGDDVINATEHAQAQIISGSATGATTGNTVSVTIGTTTYTTVLDANGNWSIGVPASVISALAQGDVTITATVTDSAGNSGTASHTVSVALGAPVLNINTIAVDDIINATEKGADLSISGTSNQPAGTQVTVTLNGQNYTTTADASGNWSVTVPASAVGTLGEATYTVTAAATDVDGNSGSASHNVQVNTALPGVTINVVATDDIINAAEAGAALTITGSSTAEAGQTVTVTLNGANYTGTVQTDGSWSISVPPADLSALTASNYTVSAAVSDKAGNPTSVNHNLTVDTSVPVVTINTVAGDDVINATEHAQAQIISGSATGAATGNTVTVTIGTNTFTTVLDASGNWSIGVPASVVSALANGTVTINASVTDAAGNSGSATHQVTVNTGLPTITFNAISSDNVLNADEKGQPLTISGSSTGLATGAQVTVTLNGHNYSATTDAAGNWTLTVPVSDLAALGQANYTVSASATSAAGNTASSQANLLVDSGLPGVTINTVADDDIINAAEAGADQTISGVVTRAAAGDTVTVTLGGNTYTATVQGNLSWSVTVPAADLQALGNGDLTITASVTNANGNTGSGTRDITIDANLPGLRVDTVAGDDIVNSIEHGQALVITGGSSGLNAGAVLTVTINSVAYSATVQADGSWSVGIPAANVSAWPAGPLAVDVTGQSSAGNPVSVSHPFTVDLTAVAISINTVASDDVINAAEKGTDLTLSGSTSGIESGQTVTVTFGGKTYTASVAANGSWSVNVPAADLATLPDGAANVQASVSSASGNNASATHAYSVDASAPTLTINTIASDDILNATEAGSPLTISGTSTAETGQTVTVTLNGATYTGNVQADGSWSISVPTSALGALSASNYTVSATVNDKAGNPGSASHNLAVDTTAPVLTINTVAGDDIINDAEHAQALVISGTSTGGEAGDVVSVVLNGKTYTTTLDASGNWSVGVPAADVAALSSGAQTITASVSDRAGNSDDASRTVTVNLTAPAISINTIAGDDVINATEKGSNLALSGTSDQPAGTAITVTLNGQNYSATTDASGNWSVTVPASAVSALGEATYSVTASVTNAQGNSSTVSHNVQVNTALPGVTINPVATDDIINASEAGSAQTISGQVTGAAAGSTVTVELGGKTYTATVQADLSWNVSVPAADWLALGNGELTVNASVTNAVGNTGSGTRDITIDASLPGLRVDTVAGDDVVNIIEHSQAQVITGSSSGFAAGTALTVVINNQTYAATVLANGSWSVGVPVTDVSNWPAGTLNITVSGANSAGTQTSITHPLTVDLTTVAISINAITPDDVINAAEKGAALTLSGSTSGVEAGQTVTITFGGKTYTTTVAANGSWSTTVPAADMATLRDGDASAQVRVTNVNGNSATATHEYSVDSAAPTVTINTIASDNIINASEAAAGVTVSGTSTAETGQTLTVTLNGTNYQITVQADGSWSLTLPASDLTALANNGYTLTATVSDLAGNPGSASKGVTVDTTAPVISFNTVAGDDVINNVEHSQAQIISGTATGAVAGDRLVVTIAGQQYVTSTDASGNWSVGVPANVVSGLADGTVTISATITDSAGNSSTQTHNVQVNTAAVSLSVSTISGDNIINAAEAGSALTLIGTGTNFAAGTVVTVLLNGKGYSATIQSNGSWSVNVPAADVAALSDGTSYTVSASAQDSAGNSATASRSVAVDLTAPVISINTVSTDDRLNAAEQQQPLTLNGSTSAEVGQTVTVTFGGKTYTATVAANGTWALNVPVADLAALGQGAQTITASVNDRAGNPGQTTHALTVDTVAPTVTIATVAGDDIINNAEQLAGQTISGTTTAEAGQTVTVTFNGQSWTATVGSGGSWSVFIPAQQFAGLSDGSYTISATVSDQAGNPGSASRGVTLNGDVPSVSINTFAGDDVVNAAEHGASLVISGTTTAPVGQTLTLTLNGKTYTTTVQTGGSWSYTLGSADVTALADGNAYVINASVSNAIGNIGSSNHTITVDLSAPAMGINIDSLQADTGLSASDFITSVSPVVVNGSLTAALASNETAQISIDGGVTWSTLTVTGTTWRYNDSRTLTDGNYLYQVRVIDAAGNVGATDSQNVVIDTTAPDPAVKTIAISAITTDTGLITNDFVTSDTTLAVSGTLGAALSAGESAQISIDGGTTWQNLAVNGLTWTYLDGRTLTDGNYNYQVRVIDTAGNIGATASQIVTVDTTAPLASKTIVIAGISDDTGLSSSDFVTRDTTLTVRGTLGAALAADERAQISLDGGVTWTTLTVIGTSWSYADSRTLTDGTWNYTVRVVDLAGNVGQTATQNVVVDTISPEAAKSITITGISDDTGASSSDFITSDTTLTVRGVLGAALGANEFAQISTDNGATWVNVTVAADGLNWTYVDGRTLTNGTTTWQVRVVDLAGNVGATGSQSAQIDTVNPAQVLTIASISTDTGSSATDFITSDTTLTLTGSLGAGLASGEVAQISLDGGATWTTLTTNGTQWTYTDSRTLTDGSYVYQVRVLDLAGNTGPVVSKTVVVDTINPTATPTIVSYTDDVGQRQGTFSNSQATDDTTPLLNGVLSAPLASGEVVYLYRNGLLLGAVTMVGALNWTYSDSGLVSGAYTYSARVVDLAGNITSSSDFILTVDTSIPTTLAQITNQTTRDTTPIISGVITAALASGQYVEVVINGKTYTSQPGGAVVVDPAHNTWYVQLPDTDALAASATAYNVTAQVKSSAGNGNTANVSNGTVTVNAAIDYTPAWTTTSKSTAWGLTYGLDNHGMWTVLANQQIMQSTDPLTWSKTALTLVQSGNNYATSSIADYNRNGTGDLFITRDDYGTGYINGFTNNGDGTFSSAIQVNVGTLTWYGSIVAFDKEGDGYLDFWIGDAGGPDSNTFLWNNAGTLTGNSTTANNGGSATVGGAVTGYLSLNEGSGVDLNNDGRIDLVQHTFNLNNNFTLSSLISQGNGTFVWGQNTVNTFLSSPGSGGNSTSVSMTWADFDGDGDMDLFLPASQGRANYGSLLFNTNGVLGSPVAVGATATTYASQFSLAVDWDHDGLMDIARIAQTGQSYLYTNVSNASNWTQSALGGSQSGTTSGVAAMDYDWDGAVDVLVTKQSGSVFLIRNTNTVSYGTSLHLRITDPNGINVYYGNTVKLYNSAGVLVATQIINPQSGMGVNDTSALVNFYGLNAGETYNAVLIKSTGTTASNIDQTVNTNWGGLQATDATHAYDLSAEAGTASNNGKFVGTGYNDTFFATAGTDTYDGSGGWVYSSGTGTWLANGGMDVVDFRLSTVGVTANLSVTTAQATGFNTSTFTNIEGISGSNFNDTLTGSSGDNQLEGRGGNDTINIGNGGHDTLLYKLLSASDATGGNGSDVVNGFTVGTWEGTADTDRIDIRELLQGSGYTGNGKASYVNGVATLDAQAGNIGDFVKVTQSGSDTIVQIDRDGTGGTFATANVVTLTGVHTDLATLLANHQLMVV